MIDKIQEMKDKLKENGYYASDKLSKLVLLFEGEGKRGNKSIPSLFLQGKSGVGKTYLAEVFARAIGAEEKFVQCFPRMGEQNFHKDIDAEVAIDKQVNGGLNAEIIVKAFEFYAKSIGKEEEFYRIFNIDKNKTINQDELKDNRQVVQMGILLQALEQSKVGPVVLTIDELDKSRPEVDHFLLDFLENGRLTTGTETYTKGQYPIYTIITSNDKRTIDEALLNRSRKVEVPRPEKEVFLEILGLPENHYLGYIYDRCSYFSIRQARQYINDLELLDVAIDEDALSQYIDLDELNVQSLADLQRLEKIENGDLEFELSNLNRCSIRLNHNNEQDWAKCIKENKEKFKLYSKDEQSNSMVVNIDTIEQIQIAEKYMDFDSSYNHYYGWFEYSLSDEEIKSDDFIWAGNKNGETRFGLKLVGDEIFRVAMNRGITFVYLDSESDRTLEAFLGQEREKDESYDYDY